MARNVAYRTVAPIQRICRETHKVVKSVLCDECVEVELMVQMPYLWTKSPKVHMCVFTDISSRLLSSWTFQDIWDEVEKSDIADEDDKLATASALRLLRDRRIEALLGH